MATFAAFSEGDTPYGEHDFGAVTVCGVKPSLKIDYYDHTLAAASPDLADEAVNRRVLTLMLAEDCWAVERTRLPAGPARPARPVPWNAST